MEEKELKRCIICGITGAEYCHMHLYGKNGPVGDPSPCLCKQHMAEHYAGYHAIKEGEVIMWA